MLIFTSDNGSPQRDGEGMNGEIGSVKRYGHDPSRPWRGLKADIWEAGHRVPFVVRWPGHVKPNTESDEPLVLTDILRTVARIVGHQLPADAGEDSFDMLPVLRGEIQTKSVRDHMIHHSGDGTFAIRQGKWKLILGRGSGGFTQYEPPKSAPAGQLYDLSTDSAEKDNLYASRSKIVSRLGALLNRYETQGRSVPLRK